MTTARHFSPEASRKRIKPASDFWVRLLCLLLALTAAGALGAADAGNKFQSVPRSARHLPQHGLDQSARWAPEGGPRHTPLMLPVTPEDNGASEVPEPLRTLLFRLALLRLYAR
jgi:hypothetical protein